MKKEDLRFYAEIGIYRLRDMWFKKLQESNYTDERARQNWEYYSNLYKELDKYFESIEDSLKSL